MVLWSCVGRGGGQEGGSVQNKQELKTAQVKLLGASELSSTDAVKFRLCGLWTRMPSLGNDLRAKGCSGVQEQLPSLLKVSGHHKEKRFIHLQPIFTLPVPTLITQLLCLVYLMLHCMPVAKGYV